MLSYYFVLAQNNSFPTLPIISYQPCLIPNYIPYINNPSISNLDSYITVSESINDKNMSLPVEENVDIQPIKSPFKYAKKNVQSNVVNQVYSYISTSTKSSNNLKKILKCKQKISVFYEILKQAKKKNNKYMGRKILKQLTELGENHIIRILHNKINDKSELTIQQMKISIRILISQFLKKQFYNYLLSSSKLDKSTLKQHLTRGRQIAKYLQNYFNSQRKI